MWHRRSPSAQQVVPVALAQIGYAAFQAAQQVADKVDRTCVPPHARVFQELLQGQASHLRSLAPQGHLTRRLFGAILRRLVALSVPAG